MHSSNLLQRQRVGQDRRGSIYRGADGSLMPTRKDQPPPDLRYFTASHN